MLEDECDDDWVFDKDGKTRTSRWACFSFGVFPSRPLLLYACFLLYFLLVFSWRAESLKRKAKEVAAPKPVAACGGGSSGGGDDGSGVQAQVRRWDITWSVALDFVHFYWGGKGERCARAAQRKA
jgi:hypothetical protein